MKTELKEFTVREIVEGFAYSELGIFFQQL